MPFCKYCGDFFDWGYDTTTGRWNPLEPIETHDDLEKSFVDEQGILRADHRDRCRGKTVNVTRLDHKIPPEIGDFMPKDDPGDQEKGWKHKAKVAFGRARIAESEGCQ